MAMNENLREPDSRALHAASTSGRVVLAENVTLAPNVTVEGVCEHDWRVNPVVCTTTPTGDAELWMCLKCGATQAGPLLRWSVASVSKKRVGPFDPETWERRG